MDDRTLTRTERDKGILFTIAVVESRDCLHPEGAQHEGGEVRI